jgi:hypothetical protein
MAKNRGFRSRCFKMFPLNNPLITLKICIEKSTHRPLVIKHGLLKNHAQIIFQLNLHRRSIYKHIHYIYPLKPPLLLVQPLFSLAKNNSNPSRFKILARCAYRGAPSIQRGEEPLRPNVSVRFSLWSRPNL